MVGRETEKVHLKSLLKSNEHEFNSPSVRAWSCKEDLDNGIFGNRFKEFAC